MAKTSGSTRNGSSRNPRGVGAEYRNLGDYFRAGASDRLSRMMSSIDGMEREIDHYTETAGRATGLDTNGGDWRYNNAVYTSVFGSDFNYGDERIQNEGIRSAIRKAVYNMDERERAALVLAYPTHDRSVNRLYLNQKDGTTRTPLGPYEDDVAATSLMSRTKAERKTIFDNWRKNMQTMSFDGGFYQRKR